MHALWVVREEIAYIPNTSYAVSYAFILEMYPTCNSFVDDVPQIRELSSELIIQKALRVFLCG